MEFNHVYNPTGWFSVNPNDYKLVGIIGFAKGATVYKAKYLPGHGNDLTVEVKIFDPYRIEDPKFFWREIGVAACVCTFPHEGHLWVVMVHGKWDSIHSIMSLLYPDGLPEASIAFVLYRVLLRLVNLHLIENHVHTRIDLSHIMVSGDGNAELEFHTLSYERVWRNSTVSSSMVESQLPQWAASPPELIENPANAYSYKRDVWLVGLTALQLAYGRFPFSNRESLEAFLTSFKDRKRNLRRRMPAWACACFSSNTNDTSEDFYFNGKILSMCFWDLVVRCLTRDPSERPYACALPLHKFFLLHQNQDASFQREVLDQLRAASYWQLNNQTNQEINWTFDDEMSRLSSASSSSTSY